MIAPIPGKGFFDEDNSGNSPRVRRGRILNETPADRINWQAPSHGTGEVASGLHQQIIEPGSISAQLMSIYQKQPELAHSIIENLKQKYKFPYDAIELSEILGANSAWIISKLNSSIEEELGKAELATTYGRKLPIHELTVAYPTLWQLYQGTNVKIESLHDDFTDCSKTEPGIAFLLLRKFLQVINDEVNEAQFFLRDLQKEVNRCLRHIDGENKAQQRSKLQQMIAELEYCNKDSLIEKLVDIFEIALEKNPNFFNILIAKIKQQTYETSSLIDISELIDQLESNQSIKEQADSFIECRANLSPQDQLLLLKTLIETTLNLNPASKLP